METTVPDELLGCWRRDWIRLADGTVDDTTQVYWLQHRSAMVDIRIPATLPPANGRTGFDDLTTDELAALAGADASCGRTTCTPIEVGADGVRRATARWLTRGELTEGPRTAFHPVTAYPEPGLMEWDADGSVVIERAPSGAYVERWSLIPGSRDDHEELAGGGGRRWFRTGPVAAVVRDRPTPVPRPARLPELLADCGRDRARMHALLDCEFSVALATGDDCWRIEVSTLPWRTGTLVRGGIW